jgi:hypothetical protein
MPALPHSPADVLRHLLVNNGQGVLPSAVTTSWNNTQWPIGVSNEPDTPDNCVTLYDTEPLQQGRIMFSGEKEEKYGVQVRVRSDVFTRGWTKAHALAVYLDETVSEMPVTISGTSYLVHAVSRRGGVLPLGQAAPDSKRQLFTFDVTVTLRLLD